MTDFETLTGLVARYSPTGREANAVGWLVERMKNLRFSRAFADEIGNAVGILGEGANQLVLLGHIDTVSGEIPVRVEDGVLHGRGSVDAKGPLAAFVDGAARVGPVPGWQIIVIGAVEEEGESAGARHVASRYRPRLAVIGEPSGWDRVTLGYRGILRFDYRMHQPVGHTASGGNGVCEGAVAFWNRLAGECAAENRGRTRIFDQVTPALQEMHSATNGFIEQAEIGGNVRLPLQVPPQRMEELLRAAAGGGGTVQVSGTPIPAYRAEKNTPVVGALLSGIRLLQGSPSFSLKLGTADMNILGPEWKCPLAVYGPGDSNLDHTPEERISLADYEKAVQVIIYALRRLTAEAKSS